MRRGAGLMALLVAAGLSGGCIERRFVVTSDPPGALVYRNGQPIGTTPVDDSFVYYGKYNFTLQKDGYETLNVVERVRAPWYEYPPLDFFTENVWPFKVRDIRRPHFQMQPLQAARHDDVLNRATDLRGRGQMLVPFNPASVPPRGGVQPGAIVPAPAPSAEPSLPPPASTFQPSSATPAAR